MILEYKNFLLILERKNLAKEYIKDSGIEDEFAEMIKNIVKKNPNLYLNFLKYYHSCGTPIFGGSNYWESLGAMMKYIHNHKQQLKNHLPKDIIEYETFEELVDDIREIEDRVTVKKEFINNY